MRTVIEHESSVGIVTEVDAEPNVLSLWFHDALRIVIVDLEILSEDDLGIVSPIARCEVPPRLIIRAACVTVRGVQNALDAGARGIILKEASHEVFVACLREVAQGRRFIQCSEQIDTAQAFRLCAGVSLSNDCGEV